MSTIVYTSETGRPTERERVASLSAVMARIAKAPTRPVAAPTCSVCGQVDLLVSVYHNGQEAHDVCVDCAMTV